MNLTYTWAITGLTKDTAGTVVKVHWVKTGTDENGITGVFNMQDSFSGGDPESDSYIPFENLSEADVIAWVKGKVTGRYQLDVDFQIQRQIQDQIDSTGVSEAPMPWVEEEELPV